MCSLPWYLFLEQKVGTKREDKTEDESANERHKSLCIGLGFKRGIPVTPKWFDVEFVVCRSFCDFNWMKSYVGSTWWLRNKCSRQTDSSLRFRNLPLEEDTSLCSDQFRAHIHFQYQIKVRPWENQHLYSNMKRNTTITDSEACCDINWVVEAVWWMEGAYSHLEIEI